MTDASGETLRLFAQKLRQLHRPLLQEADLAVCFLLALDEAGRLVDDRNVSGLNSSFSHFKEALLDLGGAEEFKEGGQRHGYLLGMAEVPEAEPALCSIDPFAYVSHLSAMAWHGLTDRIPNTLFITRPSAGLWKQLSDHRLRGQLGELFKLYRRARFPAYRRLAIRKLRNRPLNIWSSSRLDQAYQAAYKNVSNGRVRVATVGRCFLDMVREPALCGGIYHVIEVFEEHGASYTEAIFNEIDQHGNKLEQARAGYLLERADPDLASHAVIETWAGQVTRGGSRKLDPASDYADTFSKRWALSINV